MLTQEIIWYSAYILVLVGMSGYGLHRLIIVYLYWKNVRNCPKPKELFKELPMVTVQLPVFNEMLVVDRLLEAVAHLDYPKNKLEIQILDDSTDCTTELCMKKAEELRSRGYDAVCLHRTDRSGYKAGALEAATRVSKGDFIFILDADFQPSSDVLMKQIHYFTDEKVGLVQTRWEHINRNFNLLTHLQAIFLDGHFMMEQTARNRSGRFFTFNGTAGIWRKAAIKDAGGWEHDTLTEDMDLSYRAQMKGWHFVFLNDVVTPAELPVDMDGFKAQQHRWTKGSIQVCQKMLGDILRARIPLKAKLEATTHLTANYSYLLLILLCFLIYPVVMEKFAFQHSIYLILLNFLLFFFASIAVCIFYTSAQIAIRPRTWWKELVYLPFLLALGIGMSVNNAKAVLEAVVGHQSSFVRTPKYGIGKDASKKQASNLRKKGYKAIKSVIIPLVEIAFGCFFLWMIIMLIMKGSYLSAVLMSPFLGFFYTSLCSIECMIAGLFGPGKKAQA